MVPYVLSIACYVSFVVLLMHLGVFRFVSSIILSALVLQILCAIINIWWKISTHTAAIGGVAGALLAFSALFAFNPVWWLCLTLIKYG